MTEKQRRIIYLLLGITIGFLLSAAIARADSDNRGVSWIGQMCSAKTNCSDIMNAYANATTLNAGWLYLTFNDKGCKCSPKFLADPRPKNVRVTLCNSTCFAERGRKCQPYECFAGETIKSADAKIRKRDPKILQKLVRAASMAKKDFTQARNLNNKRVNVCLECDLSPEARKIMNETVAPMFPGAELVDNPLTGSCLPGYKCEKHGTADVSAGQIVDLDGIDYDSVDIVSWGKKNDDADMVLGWKLCNNGLDKCPHGKTCPFIAPMSRNHYCGSSRDARDFAEFTQPNALSVQSAVKDADRKGCKKFLNPKDGNKKDFTWKLGDDRAFAVTLFPRGFRNRFKKIEALKDGKVVDKARYRGLYTEDRTNRLIYDWNKHTASFPDNTVIHADSNCWILDKPGFRID